MIDLNQIIEIIIKILPLMIVIVSLASKVNKRKKKLNKDRSLKGLSAALPFKKKPRQKIQQYHKVKQSDDIKENSKKMYYNNSYNTIQDHAKDTDSMKRAHKTYEDKIHNNSEEHTKEEKMKLDSEVGKAAEDTDQLLNDTINLKRAIVVSEILDKPVSLRD